ncbi:NAD(P)-dependent oxidoreductase [Marivibrio halodurans]|uniref:NAD(P)-dependent oxidoreductase n=1 Tax=Marivibrio halodurans TaxID=2039722 RepID=A0A8J7S4M2_9PROT|nr:NAD(P)-dependent oxidoreductase [Marivibrio halodurans]MBP5856644.1 NAD(P)-dependent oxidoreductase [Marivibrio halodurans]
MGQLDGRKVAFIGLGLMGKPMARNLRAAGAEVLVHNRSKAPQEELAAEGFATADSPAEAARWAGAEGTVIGMVTDTPAARRVLVDGETAVLAGIASGALVVDMGTTQVMDTREMAERFAEAGAAFVDAPVSGGQVGAEGGSLTIMAGGTDENFARALPFFEAMGKTITHVGDVGAGQVAKSANQMIVALTLGAVGEAFALARRAGVDPAKVREALQGGFAGSRILELHGQRMIDRSFTPGGRVSVQRKDVVQALALAEEVGITLPGLSRNKDLWDALIEAGHQDLDHSALVKAIDPGW